MKLFNNKFRMFTLFACLLVCLTAFSAIAQEDVPETITKDGLTYYVQNNEAYLIAAEDWLTEVSVPKEIEGYPIVEIRDAFKNHQNIQVVNLPEGLISIGNDAFYGCQSLNLINLPSTLTQIGSHAFYGCSNLIGDRFVEDFDGGNYSPDDETPDGGGYVPDEDEKPEDYKPEDYKPDNYKPSEEIETPSYIGELTIPAGVKQIGAYAFFNCCSLTKVNFEGDTESIGASAFESSGLCGDLSLPEGIKTISKNAFKDTAISRVIVPEGVRTISEGAFSGCSALKEIYLPKSLVYLRSEALYNCASLQKIEIAEGGQYFKTIDGILYSADSKTLVKYPTAQKNETLSVPEGVEILEALAFDHAKGIGEISLPEGLKKIAANCFESSSLSAVNLPSSLEVIGNYAFSDCSKLSSITIPRGASLGACAFERCGLSSVVIEEGVSYISSSCFSSCEKLKKIDIPSTVSKIDINAFYSCTNLESVSLKYGIEIIEGSAFSKCYSLSKIEIPESVTQIGDRAFASSMTLTVTNGSYAHRYAEENGYTYLLDGEAPPSGSEEETELTDGDFVYSVVSGEATLKNYTGYAERIILPSEVNGYPIVAISRLKSQSVTHITLPEGLLRIEDGAFSGNANLAHVDLPSTLTYIGASAFASTAIGEISLPDSLLEISISAFENCKNLRTVFIPKNLRTIGNRAFFGTENLESFEVHSENKHFCAIDGNLYTADLYAMKHYCFGSGEETVVIPEGVQVIDPYTFYYCRTLKKVVLPSSLIWIKEYSFACSDLETLFIPKSVSIIDEYAFTYCRFLKNVTVDGEEYYPGEHLVNRKARVISGYAFYNCDSLEKLSVCGDVETLGEYAFASCESLNKLVIGDGMKNMYWGNGAFEDCPNLKFATLPETLEDIGVSCFSTSFIYIVYEDSFAHRFAVQNGHLYYVTRKTENPNKMFGVDLKGTVYTGDLMLAENVEVSIYYADGYLKETVLTNGIGRYEFTYVETGEYLIVATDSDGISVKTSVTVVRINDYEVAVLGDTDLVFKSSHYVRGSLSEKNATVTLTDLQGKILRSASVTNGEFHFEKVPAGEYIIKAENDSAFGYTELIVFDENIDGVFVELNKKALSLVGCALIRGRDGKTYATAWVNIAAYDSRGTLIAAAKTDIQGNFRFNSLPQEPLFFVATASEMREDIDYGYERAHDLFGYAYANLTEKSGEYQLSTIILDERDNSASSVSGKITAKGSGQICNVVLSDTFGSTIAKYTTKNNGKYKFVNIPNGVYLLTATSDYDGFGQSIIFVCNGEIYGETDLKLEKADKIKEREERFEKSVPSVTSLAEAEAYRSLVADEKRFYDKLTQKEKLQLSTSYVEKLISMTELLSECNYETPDGVTVEMGGSAISGNEIESGAKDSFTVNVTVTEVWEKSAEGINNEQDHVTTMLLDFAQGKETVKYYDITMTKDINGEKIQITDVYKNTGTYGKFLLTIPIPDEYKGQTSYSIVHVHLGNIVTLADLDDDPNTITVEVDKFSAFVLVADENSLTEDTADEDSHPDSNAGDEGHECDREYNGWEKFWNAVLNFFRKLFGFSERCVCGYEEEL